MRRLPWLTVSLILAAAGAIAYAGSPDSPFSSSGAASGVSIAGTETITGPKTFSSVITSSVASGSNGYAQGTGTKIDVGAGANDYFDSNGTRIGVAGNNGDIGANSFALGSAATGATQGMSSSGSTTNINCQSTSDVNLGSATGANYLKASDDGVRMRTKTLPTCTLALDGYEIRDPLGGGTGTSHRSRKCWCTSDGAASPVSAWVNMVTGTVGTTTTCSD